MPYAPDHHRFDCVRLPDVFPGQVHRSPAARSSGASESELSRGHDGQTPRRLRAEHRLHAGAARRTAVAHGDGGAGFRRLPALARVGGRRYVARKDVPGKFTASFFCSTDSANNQIASFYTGAMAHAGELSFRTIGPADLAIISPNDPAAMTQYAAECRAMNLPFIFDPGQQCARMSGEELADGSGRRRGAHLQRLRMGDSCARRPVWTKPTCSGRVSLLVVTLGEHGSRLTRRDVECRGARRRAAPDRRSDRRRRRVPRRVHEGARVGHGSGRVRANRQRRGDLRARASRRTEPRLHVCRSSRPGTKRISARGRSRRWRQPDRDK